MDEFSLIEKYFAPLAKDFKGSLNLSDDAAIISIPAGHELVITKDAISEGVHFVGDESPELIAQKLLRVNLSDLAAMGAKPLCYFLAVMLPKDAKGDWLKLFAAGLAKDQKEFRIHLSGGDTISTRGTKSFSITALGTIAKGRALKRSGAKVGDKIYVSGTLGDSALGLHLLLSHAGLLFPSPVYGRRWRAAPDEGLAAQQPLAQRAKPSPRPLPQKAGEGDEPHMHYENTLINRYHLPHPRLALGQKLIGIASACMDISDGLVQDLGHICKASGAGATIHRNKLPLSTPAKKLIAKDKMLWEYVFSGGDDYELLFTVPPAKKSAIKKLAKALKLPLTEIGEITKGKDVMVLDENAKILEVKHKGFQHF